MCGCADRQKVCIGAKKYFLFKMTSTKKKNLISLQSVLACVTELWGQTMPDVQNRKLFVSNNSLHLSKGVLMGK